MESNNNNKTHFYCLILAGGRGRRLWPVSREERPKQFIDFFGMGKSLLQQTYERFAAFLPQENIYIATHVDYAHLVREQLPQIPEERILCEPIHRNTAPTVAWTIHRINMRDKNGVLVVTPSDQLIQNERAFEEDIINGMSHCHEQHTLLTMGIRPSRPEPGYGYIQMGEKSEGTDYYKVQSFTEKPEREFAEIFMNSGEFLWNTGLFIAHMPQLREAMYSQLPAVMRSLDAEKENATWQEESEWVQEHYAMYPNMSLETGILEPSDNVCVMECNFGWADIGSWHGIYEALMDGADSNVVLNSESILTDSHGNVVRMPEGHTVVINGLDNFIVAEQDNILLITPRSDSSNKVKMLLNKYENR